MTKLRLALTAFVAIAAVVLTVEGPILGNWETAIAGLNAISTLTFPALLGLTLGKQIGRVRWYRRQHKQVPVILKRGILLMLGFAYLYGSGLFLRVTGLNAIVVEVGPARFIYFLISLAVMIAVFAYYTKTEYIDIEDPNRA